MFSFVSPFSNVNEKAESYGLILPESPIVYSSTEEALLPSDTASAQTISLVLNKLEFRLDVLHVNQHFIVYPVRSKLRFIHQQSGLANLIKGFHERNITELCLSADPPRILSIAEDLSLMVSEMIVSNSNVESKCLFFVKGDPFIVEQNCRVAFHPLNWNLFAFSVNSTSVYLADLTQLQSLEPREFSCLAEFGSEVNPIIFTHEANVTAFCFSTDGSLLITATSDGFANIWSTDTPKLLKRYSLFTSAGAIQTIKVFGSIGSPDYEGNFLLLSATHQNTHLRLFDLKNGDLLHEFTMTSTEGQFSSLAIDQKSSTVFLSNTARPSIIGLHIRGPQPSEVICETTKDYLLSSTQNIDTTNCRFDFLTEIRVEEPVISLFAYRDIEDVPNKVGLYCVQPKLINYISVSQSDLYSNEKMKQATSYSNGRYDFPSPKIEEEKSIQESATETLISLLLKNTSKPAAFVPVKPDIFSSIEMNISDSPSEEKEDNNVTENASEVALPPNSPTRSLKSTFGPPSPVMQSTHGNVNQLLSEIRSMEERVLKEISAVKHQRGLNVDHIMHQIEAKLGPKISSSIAKSVDSKLNDVKIEDWMQTIVAKSIKTPMFQEALVNGVNDSVKEVLTSNVLPGLQRSINEMLRQIHQTFEEGLKRGYKSNQDDTLQKVTKSLESFRDSANSSMSKLLQESIQDMTRTLQRTLINEISKISNESLITRTESSGPMSAVTPTPMEMRHELDELIKKEDYETALVKALSANEPVLLMYVCGKLKPGNVFLTDKCLISQAAVLSLIHQLTWDMSKNVSLRLNWLQECLMNLNRDDPTIASHVPRVLGHAKKKIEEVCGKEESSVNRMAKVAIMMLSGLT